VKLTEAITTRATPLAKLTKAMATLAAPIVKLTEAVATLVPRVVKLTEAPATLATPVVRLPKALATLAEPVVRPTDVLVSEWVVHCFGAAFTASSSTSKMSVEFGGMPGRPCGPYAKDGGMTSLRFSPTFIPATPWSQPLITCP
jgi:hypothetical protein